MNKIKILPPEIYTRIAAGEVIERPSNVLKELLENSIDANSSSIIVEIVSAGKKLIRVTDDGCGMSKSDLSLCIEPHSTSKITNFEDIYNLSTLGFRGEALSSIVNVSKTTIISKTKESKTGYQLVVHGGEVVSFKECSTHVGTTVEVRDLFYNVPARLKFLKSNYTEKIHIIRTIEEYAIVYNNINFKFFSDNEMLFSFNKTDSILERIKEVLKSDIVEHLIYFEDQSDIYKIYGFISPLDYTQTNKSFQMFYVNKRPIVSKVLTQALYDAYENNLPTGRHPVGLIFIEAPPNKIDVNIHPKKKMVKFFEEEFIYRKIRSLITEKIKRQKPTTKPLNLSYISETSSDYTLETSFNQTEFTFYKSPNKTFNIEKLRSEYEKIGIKDYVYLGQLNRTYLLFETNNGLTIIDQHAAAERITFEKFLNEASKDTSLNSQKLLFPINLELKTSDFEAIKPFLEELNKLGFEIIISGKSSIGFYSIPSVIKIENIKEFILKFIDNLLSDIRNGPPSISSREKIIRSACRASIKANETLNLYEVEEILKELSNCEQPFFCPHGRPTIINIQISEIEKMFLRKK